VTILLVTPRDNRAAKRCATWADGLAAKFPGTFTTCTPKSRHELDDLLECHEHMVYFGHGEPDSLVMPSGFMRRKQVLVDDRNAIGAGGRILVAVACWSGKELGPTVTKRTRTPRVLGYIGWDNRMEWPPGWPDPIRDALVGSLAVLFEGWTVGECEAAIDLAFERAHDRYESEGLRHLAPVQVQFGKLCTVYWRSRLVVRGDRTAHL
jgi:hypothetical protein